MSTELIAEARRLADAATPGPWHSWNGDDDHCMNAYAVTAHPNRHEYIFDFEQGEDVVAITLLQAPRYACLRDHRWQANAEFIARARTLVPELAAALDAAEGAFRDLRTAISDLADRWESCPDSMVQASAYHLRVLLAEVQS